MATTQPVTRKAPPRGAIRTGLAPNELSAAVLDNLAYLQARTPEYATPNDWYMALAHSIRDRLLARWLATSSVYMRNDVKVACYLSAEFLMGPQLGNNLINLGIESAARDAMQSLGQDLDALAALEEEPGLGNGGLGRLAACFLDSLATLQIPAIGYGIRYEFGIFDQTLRDGWQVEITDEWLHKGNPWELIRPEISFYVKFGGVTESYQDEQGRYRVHWQPAREVKGVACDTPVLGYHVNTCNTLRLWKSEAVESFDFADFNLGDYYGAVQEKIVSETLTKVLYPNDEPEIGKRLRLAQQYFFVSCSLQDMLRLLDLKGLPIERFADVFAAQLNDTHPAIAVAELMRLLVDERLLPWDDAWSITQRTLAYTNHTLLPEALETWDLPLFRSMLPRPLEIIYEINERFLREVRQRGACDDARVARLSLIDEAGEKRVRMANLATVGTHAINGVAALHSQLLRETVLRDFAELWPERFHNVTNGVTPRRFMVLSNPALTQLLDDVVGSQWATDLSQLRKLEKRAADSEFQSDWNRIKLQNKETLSRLIQARTGIRPNPEALFDIQVKRIHEYKRQHLNALHIVTLYRRLRDNPGLDIAPRCFIFGGKAAPGYHMAKLIIRLINGIADVVNNDPATRDKLQVVFFPDFNVKNAHAIYPAANVSEQISTAGKEASGTGNMKFTMNGAITVGTLDGANVEIREEVGAENFFLFGRTAEQVQELKTGGYRPRDYYENDDELRGALEMIAAGTFSNGEPHMFEPLLDHLLQHDTYLLLADYRPYVDAQAEIDRAFRDTARWTRMSILNVARAGKFSADRSIQEYCDQIWDTRAVPVQVSEASRERH